VPFFQGLDEKARFMKKAQVPVVDECAVQKKSGWHPFFQKDGGDHLMHFPKAVVETQHEGTIREGNPAPEMFQYVGKRNRTVMLQKMIEILPKVPRAFISIQVPHVGDIGVTDQMIKKKGRIRSRQPAKQGRADIREKGGSNAMFQISSVPWGYQVSPAVRARTCHTDILIT
jgi:hypothetical protein